MLVADEGHPTELVRLRSVRVRGHAARRKASLRGRWAIAWLVTAFVGLQLAFAFSLEVFAPQSRDPEFYRKLASLFDRKAEYPNSPVIIALGSSRVYYGIRPRPPVSPNDPLLFNLGLFGAGPVQQLIALNRLVESGVRPAAAIVEVWPPLLDDRAPIFEEVRVDLTRMSRADSEMVAQYHEHPEEVRDAWRTARLVPSWGHRFVTRSQVFPQWNPLTRRLDHYWASADGWGWTPGRELVADLSERARLLSIVRACYGAWTEESRLRPRALAAMEDLLTRCRSLGIPAAVIWLPEATEIRSWYPAAIEQQLVETFARWQAAGITVLHCRNWQSDYDLPDGFHMTPDGAGVFTAWLTRDVLPHWRRWSRAE